MRKFFATAAASLTAAAALAIPAAPAQAAPTDLLGLFIGGENAINNVECNDLKVLLDNFQLLSPEDTRASLESKINMKADDAGVGAIPGLGLLKVKLASDIASRADSCGLVKKDPAAELSAKLGLPELGNMSTLFTSASAEVLKQK